MRLLPRTLLSAALALLAACPSEGAMPPSQRDRTPESAYPVSLQLIDDDDGALPVYPYHGQSWVPGWPGHAYRVRLTNRSDRRVLVVLSVDGVNAISGEDADTRQSGYVLAPWESAEIDGWRKSMQETARFVFTDLPDSYAARTGRPDNVGVVGIAVFNERMPYPRPAVPPISPASSRGEMQKQATRDASANQGVAAEAALPQRIGTGHGERSWSPVDSTRFVRASRSPIQLSQLRYDDERTLHALGILPYARPYRSDDRPRAFPGGFVPDPPGG